MARACWLLGIMMLLAEQATAQKTEQLPLRVDTTLIAPDAIPLKNSGNSSKENARSYLIEVKLIEGPRLFDVNHGTLTLNFSQSPPSKLSPVFVLKKEKSAVDPKSAATTPQPDGIAVSGVLLNVAPGKVDAQTLNGFVVFGAINNADLWNSDSRPGVTVLAAPKITVGNSVATIQVGGTQVFSYLVPVGGGRFEARQTAPRELGVKFSVGVKALEGDDHSVELSPLELNILALEGRTPVEGLDLDVGAPILSQRALETSAHVKLGTIWAISIPSGPKTQAALLLRVNRLPDDAVLLRRATLDILGRLPTVDELQQFSADTTPNKMSKWIDRLLQGPDRLADEEFLRHLMPGQEERQKFLSDKDPNKRAKLIERLLRRLEDVKWDEDAFPAGAQQLDPR